MFVFVFCLLLLFFFFETNNEKKKNKKTQKNKKNTEQGDSHGNKDHSDAAIWHSRREKRELDLEALKFRQEGHFMSNESWKLRQGSKYKNKKGYQEIYVPHISNPPSLNSNVKQIHIKDMPEWSRKAFTVQDVNDPTKMIELKSLNIMQSQCYETAFNSSENILLAAPTGAGKTNVAMLAILREIGCHLNKDGKIRLDEFKCVYIAPMKSLVREVKIRFNKRLSIYGIKVDELSGDQQLSKEKIAETQIIVTTPEKWDIITRKGIDRSYASLVRLVIIDEIHLLHDIRGHVLESIVARTVRQVETTQEIIRLVGLSATLPNFMDVAEFLRVNPSKGLFVFDSGHRPVPLMQRFAGVTLKKPFRQYQCMNDLCYEYVIEQTRNNQQVIVFVHSRKETHNVAKMLQNKAKELNELNLILSDGADCEILKDASNNDTKNIELKEVLQYGFGIHHAGMTRPDRALVEDLFRQNIIKVLVSTATLAWGVNLPAHAVIIKGTQIYDPSKGRWTELSMLDILQMFGRAGRVDFDSFGEAYLITTHSELKYYMPLLNDQLPIESQLIHRLPDVLNAEIVLGSITNLKEAVNWLGYTYLYIRMLRNPETYGININEINNDKSLEQRRIDLCHTAALILDKTQLISYNKKTGTFLSTDLGRVASMYYISYETMATYNQYLSSHMTDIEIFRVFSYSGEFKHINVREGEKDELSKLLDKVPIPVKESIDDASSKVNVLLQAYISRLKLEGFQLFSDMTYVTQSAQRLMRGLFEITLKRGWSLVSQRCLQLCKMIDHRMWSIETPLRQFNMTKYALPSLVINRIEKSNFSFERLYFLNAVEIGELIRMPGLGNTIHTLIHYVPKLTLTGIAQPITRTVIKVDLDILTDFKYEFDVHGMCACLVSFFFIDF